MPFTREINRLLVGVVLCFAIVAVAAAYWAIVGPDTILRRDDNPRRVLAEAAIVRGAIVDREGEILAQTVPGETGTARREYLQPATYGALGYYSMRHGAGGVEAAFDPVLRGDTLEAGFSESLLDSLLHAPQEGSDLLLSLDLDIQAVLTQALEGHTGAGVVLAVPSGQVLALRSAPSYDPNTLDADWDSLRDAPGNPFFNRVIQGSYQPGGLLQTPLMAAALSYDQPINVQLESATAPVQFDDLTLSCAVRLPERALTLREAYAFACPQPFASLGAALEAEALAATLETFGINRPATVAGLAGTDAGRQSQGDEFSTPLTVDAETLVAAALGQGKLTVSPLSMAVMVAGIVNDGNAPQPYMLLATRAPGQVVWNIDRTIRPTTPIATVNTARQLQDLMRFSVANGAAQNAARPNVDIGGHTAVAYSGEGPQTWFIGFATLPGRQGVATAIVLEDVEDPGLAADIGGMVLAAAARDLQTHAILNPHGQQTTGAGTSP